MARDTSAGNVEDQDILAIDPPGEKYIPGLLRLYGLWDKDHASGTWAMDLKRRLAFPHQSSLDCFYLVPFADKVAAALDVSRSATFSGLGIVHRVFAHPHVRRKGLARKLIEEAMARFKTSGGRLLILVAPEAGAARRFYQSLGFREIVRAQDGEILFGWAARGRHVREAAMRLLKQAPVRWRPASPGDWAGLLLYSSLPGGKISASHPTLLDSEWIDVLNDERGGEQAKLEVGESRHGYIVSARCSSDAPDWLQRVCAKQS